jgi:hypothetical protein
MVSEKNKTEGTNKLTLLAFKIITILHNTRLATFIKLLETVSKCLFRNRSQNSCHTFLDCHRTAAIQERVTNNKEQTNHQNPGQKHKGIIKTKKERKLNIEELYKIESNHSRDYEL